MDYSRIARKLRERIAGFSGELSRGLPTSQSVVLNRGAKLR